LQKIHHQFQQRQWQGNIRELRSAVRRLIAYAATNPAGFSLGPDSTYTLGPDTDRTDTGLIEARERLDRQMITDTLKRLDWHKAETAAALKISRQYLFKLMTRYDMDKPF